MGAVMLGQALSVNGRCKTFDDSADGYGRGEAFVVACLMPAQPHTHYLAVLQVGSWCTMIVKVQSCAAASKNHLLRKAHLTCFHTWSWLSAGVCCQPRWEVIIPYCAKRPITDQPCPSSAAGAGVHTAPQGET